MRHRTVIALLLLVAAACSTPDRARRAASPAAPSVLSIDTTPMGVGGIAGPMDVLFPSRTDAFQFRNDLETKYGPDGLNRPASTTYVDREGDVVWVQEYIRYRVNGCDHNTALARVLTQIDGGAPGGICAENRDVLIQFPPRNELLDFRRALEVKYQQMGRPLQQTFVDIEGSVIWTQEYMRYRVNRCEHATAVQKVFAQIDGGTPTATCVPDCAYRLNPAGREVGDAQQNLSVDLIGEPGGCEWTAASDASWLTFSSDYAYGRNGITIPYSVIQNVSGGSRTGRIRVTWNGGSSIHTVSQQGSPFITRFTMTDAFRSGAATTTECHFRSAATPCTFTATSNLPGGSYVYKWTASYSYGGAIKTSTVTGSSSTFTITDACGASDASATGGDSPLDVTLTVTDDRGNTQTVRSGQGLQPPLKVVKFTC